jgi:cell division septum initiation protein DivIVA
MLRRAEVVPAQHPARQAELVEGEPSRPPQLDRLLDIQPCFRGALRGYDRLQVDNYVAWVEAELDALRRQNDHLLAGYSASQAELGIAHRMLALSPRGRELSSASDRVAEMLRLAAEEASAITAAGAEDAERIRAEARLEADARVRNAQEIKHAALAAADELRDRTQRERAEAADVLEAARRQAERVLREAAAEHARLVGEASDARARLAAMQDEIDGLRRQRDEACALLRRLAEQITRALDAVTPVVREERIIFEGNVAQVT